MSSNDIFLPPCLLYWSSASLFCQKKRQHRQSFPVRKHAQHATMHMETTQPFPSCDWDLKGEGRWAISLLVTVYSSSSIHLSPQSISPQSSEEQDLISTRGTELKDIATLSRCIYLGKAASLNWLIWIRDPVMLLLHTVAQMANAW